MLRELLGGKLGLSGDAAQAVLAFVLRKLMAGGSAKAQSGASDEAGHAAGLNLGDLLQQVGRSGRAGTEYLRSTGMPQELAEETGLDLEKATTSLQEVLDLLGGRKPAGS